MPVGEMQVIVLALFKSFIDFKFQLPYQGSQIPLRYTKIIQNTPKVQNDYPAQSPNAKCTAKTLRYLMYIIGTRYITNTQYSKTNTNERINEKRRNQPNSKGIWEEITYKEQGKREGRREIIKNVYNQAHYAN